MIYWTPQRRERRERSPLGLSDVRRTAAGGGRREAPVSREYKRAEQGNNSPRVWGLDTHTHTNTH